MTSDSRDGLRAARISYGNGGWVLYRASDLDSELWLRFAAADDGRLEITEVYLDSPEEPLTPSRLRAVADHLADAEAEVRRDPTPLERRMGLPAPDLRTAVAYYSTTLGKQPSRPTWVERMLLAQQDDSDEPQPVRPRRAPPVRPPSRDELQAATQLERPTSRPYPDGFYEQFADAYRAAHLLSSAPAAYLAEANGIPKKTVNGWTAEARRRGLLPPPRHGRAG